MEIVFNEKIPLHSIVLVICPNKTARTKFVNDKFSQYEILSPEKIHHDIFGEINYGNDAIVLEELIRLSEVKIRNGERVVVNASNILKSERLPFIELSLKYKVGLFYIIIEDNNTTENVSGYYKNYRKELFASNKKEILSGDRVARVIDGENNDISVVKKLNTNSDNLSEIKKRNFNGISVSGDVHGCILSLRQAIKWAYMRNNFIVLLGDIIDYGYDSLECIHEVYQMIISGNGVCVLGNHEVKFQKWLQQYKENDIKVKLSPGNKITINSYHNLSEDEKLILENRFNTIMNLSRNHWIFGKSLFTHGAATKEMWNNYLSRLSGKNKSYALYGEISRDIPKKDDGYPNRIYTWVDDIPENHYVFVGHDIRDINKPLIHINEQNGKAVFMDCGSGKGGSLFSADLIYNENDTLYIQNFIKN